METCKQVNNPPLQRFRFVVEPQGGGLVKKRIYVQPGNVPLERYLRELIPRPCPKNPDYSMWGRGVYNPHTSYLLLYYLFSADIAKTYAADLHFEIMCRQPREFSMNSADIARWLEGKLVCHKNGS